MKITYELDLNEFKAWSGGAETLEKIRKFDLTHPGAMDAAQRYIEECFCGDATETELNDMLWFEDGAILDNIGYYDESIEDEEDDNGFEREEL